MILFGLRSFIVPEAGREENPDLLFKPLVSILLHPFKPVLNVGFLEAGYSWALICSAL